MCRSTAGPLLAMVGVAGTAAGVAIAIVREKIDRRADTRAARQAAEEQDDPDGVLPEYAEPFTDLENTSEDEFSGAGTTGGDPVETESGESRPGGV